jgi:hypothetical protein
MLKTEQNNIYKRDITLLAFKWVMLDMRRHKKEFRNKNVQFNNM